MQNANPPYSDQLRHNAEKILADSALGIFSTIDSSGFPHATWMSAFSHDDLRQVLTITSPDSDKVANLKHSSEVEWMFTKADQTAVLYLRGQAEVVTDVTEIKRCWNRIPEKAHAFFLQYYNTGIGFATVRTRVQEATIVYPQEFRKVRVF